MSGNSNGERRREGISSTLLTGRWGGRSLITDQVGRAGPLRGFVDLS